jgi:hypothetical protein
MLGNFISSSHRMYPYQFVPALSVLCPYIIPHNQATAEVILCSSLPLFAPCSTLGRHRFVLPESISNLSLHYNVSALFDFVYTLSLHLVSPSFLMMSGYDRGGNDTALPNFLSLLCTAFLSADLYLLFAALLSAALYLLCTALLSFLSISTFLSFSALRFCSALYLSALCCFFQLGAPFLSAALSLLCAAFSSAALSLLCAAFLSSLTLSLYFVLLF